MGKASSKSQEETFEMSADHAKAHRKSSHLASLIKDWELNWESVAVIMCLSLAYLFCNASYSIISPFFPNELLAQGVSFSMIGLIIGISPLTVAILSPMYGHLVLRIGYVVSIFFGLLLIGVTNLSLGFVNLIPAKWGIILTCLILRFFEGLGSVMFSVASISLFPKHFPNSMGILLGVFEIVAGLGYVLGYVIGGILYQTGGFKLPFFTFGGCVLIVIPPVVLFLVKFGKADCFASDGEKDQRWTSLLSFLPWKALLRISTNLTSLVLMLGIVLLSMANTFYSPILQPFLSEEFSFGGLGVGLIFLISSLSYTLSILIIGPLVERLGYNRSFSVGGLAIAGGSLIVMGVLFTKGIMSPFVIGVDFAFLGLSIALGMVPVFNDFLKASKEYLGKGKREIILTAYISGLVTFSHHMGEFLGTIFGGILRSFLSFPMTSIILGELILAEFLLLFGLTIIRTFV